MKVLSCIKHRISKANNLKRLTPRKTHTNFLDIFRSGGKDQFMNYLPIT